MNHCIASLLGAAVLLHAPDLLAWTDHFLQDPLADPEWQLYQPLQGAAMATRDGAFHFTFPPGLLLNHWLDVDHAVQLRRADIPQDFAIETRVRFLGSGNPSSPAWPPADEAYQAGLMVHFSRYDLFYFGPFRGSSLWLERSGQGGLCLVTLGLKEISLQVKKLDDQYSFSWRQNDADPWSLVCIREVQQSPAFVGLVFKSWGPPITQQETFEFDYFSMSEIATEAPRMQLPCNPASPDPAWLGVPFARAVSVGGFPVPAVTIRAGPPGLSFDASKGILSGWTPENLGTVRIEIEATNDFGTDSGSWEIPVDSPSSLHDDDFKDNPAGNASWQLYEPQSGIKYSTVTWDSAAWWRLEVPQKGQLGLDFDTWIDTNRAPQLRRPVAPGDNFAIETRVRISQPPPAISDPFLAGLMVSFNGAEDLLHWNIGGERFSEAQRSNVFAERTGINNLCRGYAEGVGSGVPVDLRMERLCDLYLFYFRLDGAADWILAGTYRTASPPRYAGLVLKTWGGGTRLSVDFDYFSFVTPGPRAEFSVTPALGVEPLQVKVDAGAASSPHGPIASCEWDFGDGTTSSGMVQTHTYASSGKYTIGLTVTDAAGDRGTSRQSVQVLFRPEDISPWLSADIGDPPPLVRGGARLEADGCMTIYAGGSGFTADSEQFHYVYQTVRGDASITFKLEHVEWPTGDGSATAFGAPRVGGGLSGKIGQCIEKVSKAVHAAVEKLSDKARSMFSSRGKCDGKSSVKEGSKLMGGVVRLKLERKGDEFIGSYSTDGIAWMEISRVTLAEMPDEILIGIAAAAGEDAAGQVVTAKVCDVQLTGNIVPAQTQFLRGDSNGDGAVDVSDALFTLGWLFLGTRAPGCQDAADANDSSAVDLSDAVYTLTWLFLGGPLPPGPGPAECGPDETGDSLPACVYPEEACGP